MLKCKNYLVTLILTLTAVLSVYGATTPSAAVCNVYTFDAEGKLYGSANGFFITSDGLGVAPYEIFQNASRAEVITADGKKHEVYRICGASSIYNLVKFSLKEVKTEALTVASEPVAKGASLKIVTFPAPKAKTLVTTTAQQVSDFNDYKFYDLAAPNHNQYVGCPVIDAAGKVVGVVQKNNTKNALTACAMDARTIKELIVNSVGSINFDLRKINIPKVLPSDENEALAFIYMMNKGDSLNYTTALEDFITAFPGNAEGYVNRGIYKALKGRYNESDADFQKAASVGATSTGTMKKDGVYHAYAKTIYDKVTEGGGEDINTTWSYAGALSMEEKAYSISPNPLYLQQKGNVQYAMKDYQGAYNSFKDVNNSVLASSQSYYSTALSLEKIKGSDEEILTLLDSAVAKMQKPYTVSQAQYLYFRAIQEIKMQKYHNASIDFYEYEKVIGPNQLTALFYYNKEQTERKARMYKQALEDIRTAQAKSEKPDYYLYRLEESSLLLQVGQWDDAIATAQDLLNELPENPDCYKIIGIAYGEKKQKALAIKNLNKAKELGDDTVDAFLKKYK